MSTLKSVSRSVWSVRTRLLITLIAVAAVLGISWTLLARESNVEASTPESTITAILEGGFALPDADGHMRTYHLNNTSNDQQAALADREVTWEEYEAATLAAVNCMQDAGLELRSTPALDASGKMLVYGVTLNGTDEENRQTSETSRECMVHHSLFTDLVWQIQLKPSEEAIRAAQHALANCLISRGVPSEVVDHENPGAALAHSPGLIFPECANEVQRDFGIPNFGG